MPTTLILMQKGPATMFVPPDKLQQYLADGWKEIERKVSVDPQPKAAAAPPAEPKASKTPKAPKTPKAGEENKTE